MGFPRNNQSSRRAPVFLETYREPEHSPRHKMRRFILYGAFFAFCLIYGFEFGQFAPAMTPVFAAPIALLLLISIWALPDMRRGPVGLLEPFLFAFLIVTFMWPKYMAVALPGLPWITLTRLVGIPLVLILLISLSVSQVFRDQLKHAMGGAPLVWRFLACFVGVQALSIAFSHAKSASFQLFVLDQLNWTAIFFISCFVFSKPGRATKYAAILCVMAVLLSLVGMVEYRQARVLWAGHIPAILRINDPNVLLVLAGENRNGDYRAVSTFTTSLTFSEFLQLCIPFVFHFIVTAKRFWIRALALVSAPVLLLGIFASGSRSGVLGFGIASLIYFLFWAILRWQRIKAGLIAPAVVLSYPALAALSFASTFLVAAIRRKVWGGGETLDSTLARKEQYASGIPKVLSHPFGHGIGQGAEVLGFQVPSGLFTIDTYYLLIALEYGFLGIIFYYGMILIAIWNSGKYSLVAPPNNDEFIILIPVMISLINFVITNSVFSQTDNHSLIFMNLGLVVALACQVRDAIGQSPKRASARSA